MIPHVRHYTKIIILALLLVFSACSPVSNRSNQVNSNGNINNSGLMVETSGWVYFMNLQDEQKLYRFKVDGTSPEKFSDAKAGFLNVYKQFLYYLSGEDSKIHRINLDDKKDEVVSSFEVSRMMIDQDTLVYLENDKLFRMDLEDNTTKQLSEQEVISFNLEDSRVYFINKEKQLFKIDQQESKVSDKKINQFNVFDGVIFYQDESDQRLYKMKIDGSEGSALSKSPVSVFNVTKDWVYYGAKENDKPSFMKMKLDGSDSQLINDSNPFLVNVSGDWINYLDMNLSSFEFKSVVMKTDGSNRKEYLMVENSQPTNKIELSKMNELVEMKDYRITVESMYKTNILKSMNKQDSVIFDDVTDGMYVFVNYEIENTSNQKLELSHLVGLITTVESQEGAFFYSSNKKLIDSQYTRDGFEDSVFYLNPQEKMKIQCYFQIERNEPIIFIGLKDQQQGDTIKAVELMGDSYFVASFQEANEIMNKIFEGSEVVQGPGLEYTFEGETIEKMYYSFTISEKGQTEPKYYLLERDSKDVYLGKMDNQFPDYPIPTELYQP